MRQAPRLGREGFVFAHARGRGGYLLRHVPQVVGLAQDLFLLGPQLLLALRQRLPALVSGPHRSLLELRAAIGIQQVALHLGAEQRLRLVLAVQVHQQSAELGQHSHRRGAAVHPGAGSSLRGDLTLEDEGAVLCSYPQGGKGR